MSFPSLSNPLALHLPLEEKFYGQAHWERVQYSDKEHPGFIDRSTLSANGSGDCYIYAERPCIDHFLISIEVIIAVPIYAAGVIAYNALRIPCLIFYIGGRIIYDYAKKDNRQTFSEIAKNHLTEMGKQVWISISNIIRTPFYMLGYLFGLLYGLVDPMNGRKLAATFERNWNHGIHRHQSYWSTQGRQKNFKFEGGGAVNALGQHGFYLAGCIQPFAIAHYENNKLTGVSSVSGHKSYRHKMVEPLNCCGSECRYLPIGCKA